jgi:asparagine synthase (glutamine-hydrolysing)
MQKTFSARYEDNRHDEGSFIDQVVRKTGVDARFTYPTGKGLLEDVTNLIRCQEEPFGSTSIYAQWKVFKVIKESGVTVALDGQGADELLAGYHDYFIALFSHLLTTFQLQALAREFGACLQLHRKRACRDLLLALSCAVPKEMKAPLRWLRGTKEKDWVNKKFAASFNPNSFPGQEEDCSLTSFDRQLYRGLLLSDLPSYLRYEDKNSMFHSIESRLPFLDYRLVEFAFSLPWEQKIFRGTTKYVLRTAMTGVVPELVRNRRDKVGFSTPEDVWFRTDLADAISSVIDSQSFQKRAFFDGDQVTKLFRAHRSGRQNQSTTLWRCLNLELWLRAFID